MAAAPRNPAIIALGAVLLLAIFAAGVCVIVETDVPWLLRAGEEILRLQALPVRDPFSYTSAQPWLNHEWLSEVALALVHRAAGVVGLGLLEGALLALVVAASMFSFGPHAAVGPLDGLAPLAWAAMAALLREGISPRAQLFSNLLFALSFALAVRDLRGDARALRWTLPIGILWTQLHGGSPHLVILLGLLCLAAPSWRHAGYAALSLLLTCAGPYGVRVHEHFLRGRATLPEIREWHPLHVVLRDGSPGYFGVVALIALAALCLLRRSRRGEPVRFEALLLLFYTAAAARYVRFITEATLIAGVIAARQLAAVPVAARRPRLGRALPLGLAIALLGGAAALSSREPGFGFARWRFPVAAVEWLAQARPPGPMFNSYNFGGYLLFAWPDERVFIDGRSFTVYSDAQIRELLALYGDPPRFRELTRRFGFRLAVLQRQGRGAALVAWLRQQPEWRVVYEDATAVILTRRAA